MLHWISRSGWHSISDVAFRNVAEFAGADLSTLFLGSPKRDLGRQIPTRAECAGIPPRFIGSMQDVTPLFMLCQIKTTGFGRHINTKPNKHLSQFENHDGCNDGIDRRG